MVMLSFEGDSSVARIINLQFLIKKNMIFSAVNFLILVMKTLDLDLDLDLDPDLDPHPDPH